MPRLAIAISLSLSLAGGFFAPGAALAGPSVEGVTALTQLARAYYLMGESEKAKGPKLKYLDHAIAASDRALRASPGAPHALYWRSMALVLEAGVVNTLRALGMVREALRGLEKVSSVDPAYDSAGAYRSRGKVLIEAPAWAFIGDRKKGLALLIKARAIAPGCLVGRLYLAQAYLKNGMKAEARGEIGYILAAPVEKGSRDDLEVKDDARRLLTEMGNR